MDENIFNVLKKDHEGIINYLEQMILEVNIDYELFLSLKEEILNNLDEEEKFLYPEIEESEELRLLVYKGYEEHKLIKIVVDELSGIDEEDETFIPKIRVLKELFKNHAMFEESEIFNLAEEVLDINQKDDLFEKLVQVRSIIKEED